MSEAAGGNVTQLRQGNIGPVDHPAAGPAAAETIDGGGSDGQLPSMTERLAKLEGIVEGIRHTQTVTFAVLALVAAVMLGFGVYSMNRFDRIDATMAMIDDNVDAVPSKVRSELTDLARLLAESINAAKVAPPQVILMPAPEAPTSP